MITFTKSYTTSDKQMFGTIIEAKKHELEIFFGKMAVPVGENPFDSNDISTIADYLILNKDILIDVLTTNTTSKPKARAINGGTKKRKIVITDSDRTIAPTTTDLTAHVR